MTAPGLAVELVRSQLAAATDPEKAKAMAAYMKTDGGFYGVPKPQRKPIYRQLVREFPVGDAETYDRLVSALWAEPQRESKYLAIDLAIRWSKFHVMEQLPLFRRMITEGAWWDLVDGVASNLVGGAIRSDPASAWAVIDPWIDDEDLWIRRTAVICQLKSKADTDEERLFSFCAARAHEPEFFMRKAIGWALREHAKTNPQSVRAFVVEHRQKLSGLTYREATKHL